MLKFDQIPPTVEGTEIDPAVVCFLSYDLENRNYMKNVAEVCASFVIAHTTDMAVIKGIGEKAGQTIAERKETRRPEEDGKYFTIHYDEVVLSLVKGTSRKTYKKLVQDADAQRKEREANLAAMEGPALATIRVPHGKTSYGTWH